MKPTSNNLVHSRPFKDDDELKPVHPLPHKLSQFIHVMPTNMDSLLYCNLEVCHENHSMMLDTGASRSIISKAFYDSLPNPPPLERTRHKFKVADGRIMPAIGLVRLPLVMADKKITADFFVAHHTQICAIIGLDLMKKHQLTINVADKLVQIGKNGPILPLLGKGRTGSINNIRLVRNVKIPPRSAKSVPITLDLPKNCDKTEWTSYMCEYHPDVWDLKGIDLVEGINKNAGKSAMLCLVNNSNHGVRFPKGMIIAQATSLNTIIHIPREDKELEGMTSEEFVHECFKIETVESDEEFETQLDDITPPIAQDKPIVRDANGLHKELADMLNKTKGLTGPKAKSAILLLREFEDRFCTSDQQLTQTDTVEHYVETGNTRPIRIPPRRLTPINKKIVVEEVGKMLTSKAISISDGPWSSPIVLVKKKDGTTRFCIDYRKLNEATRKDAYPLPRIEDCLESMSGAKFFCTLDLASGYWQVKMAQEDREKTAFATHIGLFQWNVMPFGLTNAPATFERLMDKVLKGLIGKACMVYLDDIIVFGATFEETVENLRLVLLRMREHNLKLKPKKCFLFQTQVNFLGHIISADGIQTDPEKCAKVKDWPVPTGVGHVRSFLGLASYYRRFIKDFANVASPMLALLKKQCKFEWTEAHDKSFQVLKDALCSPPILAYPIDGLPYIVDTDASNTAIGAVLSQVQNGEERVIQYASATLSQSQRNYCTTKRELLAVVYFLATKFRNYLGDKRFKLRTDHASLIWLTNFKEPCAILARWITRLGPYSDLWDIEHRPGIKHGNADAMSRLPERCCLRENCPDCTIVRAERARISLPLCNIEFEEEGTDAEDLIPRVSIQRIRELQEKDSAISRFVLLKSKHTSRPTSKEIRPELDDIKVLWKFWDLLVIKNGILYKIPAPSEPRARYKLVVPQVLRDEICQHLHNHLTAGHQGRDKTQQMIRERFYWPRWRADVQRWISCCRNCSLSKKGPGRGKAPLTQDLISGPFQRIAFDVIGPLPITKRGNRFILLVVDYFTKWVEAFALPQHTAIIVAQMLAEGWVCKFGVPMRAHCDQAPEFNSKVIADLMDLLHIDKTRTTPYRPVSNGLAERSNQSIESILKCTILENRDTWDDVLPYACMAYRATPHSSIGCSPNLMVMGKEINLPVDIMYRPPIIPVPWETGTYNCSCVYIEWLRTTMTGAFTKAQELLKVAANRNSRNFDGDVETRKFNPGDWVLYWSKRLANQTLNSGWDGPYVIVRKCNETTYELRKTEDGKSKYLHCDNMCLDPWMPHRTNWVKVNNQKTSEKENSQLPKPTAATIPPVAETVLETKRPKGGKRGRPRKIQQPTQAVEVSRKTNLPQVAKETTVNQETGKVLQGANETNKPININQQNLRRSTRVKTVPNRLINEV